MKHLYALAVLTFLTFSLTAQQSIDTTFSFQTNPSKTLSIYIPSTYNPSVSNEMMIGFHPFNVGVWNSVSWRDTLITFAENNGLIMMCPDGGSNGIVDDAIDTAFTSAMCDSMQQWYNIDTSRVYAMGFSVGGRATYTYTLNHPGKVAGCIPIGAAITGTSQVNSTLQANAVCKPIWVVHGANDVPNTRYFPVYSALNNVGAWMNTTFMSGVGHTINFANRNQILSSAYQWIDSLNTMGFTPDAGVNDTLCTGDSATLGSDGIFGGSCPYTYSWAPNYNISSTNEAMPRVSPAVATTYYVTMTDAEGSTGVDSVTIDVIASPVIQVIGDTAICAGDTASITASGGTAYSWTFGNSLDCNSCASVLANPSSTTNYTISGLGTNGCETDVVYTLTVNQLPVAQISPFGIFGCEGDSINLDLNSGSTLTSVSWSDPNVSCQCETPTLTFTQDISLTAFFTDDNGCSSSTSAQVFVFDDPTIDLNDTALFCSSDASVLLQANAPSAVSFQWTSGSANDTAIVAPSMSQYYSVTATNGSGCSAADSIWVERFDYASAIDVSNLDTGGCVLFFNIPLDSLNASVIGYTWTYDGTIISNDSMMDLNYDPMLDSGLVTVSMALDNGCQLQYSYFQEEINCLLGTQTVDARNWKFFPNPVNETLNLRFEDAATRTIELRDVSGKLVLNEQHNLAAASLDLSSVDAGTYLLTVSSGSSVETVRVVVQ